MGGDIPIGAWQGSGFMPSMGRAYLRVMAHRFLLLWCGLAWGGGVLGQTGDDSDSTLNLAVVEEAPKWWGCEALSGQEAVRCTDEGVMGHVLRETTYPPKARRKGIQGKVILHFVVEKDGTIGAIEVIHGVDPLLDEEAVRVVRTFPPFAPGTQQGKPVRVRYVLPFSFALD